MQFLIRSDASTKFAPENYWGTFPSLQVGWVASKEAWFERNLPGVNFLKLRYSIGKTGKDNLQPWKWYQFYDVTVNKGWQFGTNGGQLGGGLTPKVNPNRDAKWDSTLKHNVGLDLAFLKNRLEINADFYYDITKDMLTDMGSATGVPISIGGAFAEQNYAHVDAWGSELNLNWNDKVGKVSYSVGMNFSYGDNKIKNIQIKEIYFHLTTQEEKDILKDLTQFGDSKHGKELLQVMVSYVQTKMLLTTGTT